MTYVKKASFSKGELDPSLRDKTDTQAYYDGLSTALNVIMGKTGSIKNASGTWLGALTKDNTDVRIYVSTQPQESVIPVDPVNRNYLLEFGHEYVRGYNIIEPIQDQIEGTIKGFSFEFFGEEATDYQQEDLVNLRIKNFKEKDNDADVTLVACEGYPLTRITVVNDAIDIDTTGVGFEHPVLTGASHSYKDMNRAQAAVTSQLGHPVQYGVTAVTGSGIESTVFEIVTHVGSDNNTITFPKLPTNNEFNAFYIRGLVLTNPTYPVVDYAADLKYINIYRRPYVGSVNSGTGSMTYSGNGNAWGLIGQATVKVAPTSGTAFEIGFTDFGQEADYTNPPPEYFKDGGNLLNPLNPSVFGPDGISTYNNRLLQWKRNYIGFSKIDFPRYLLRDFPLTFSTAMILNIGERMPTIFHAVESSGLYLFTSEGIYFGGAEQAVSGLNPVMKLINDTVIDKNVEPIVTPFGMFFVDITTGSIKTLSYDDLSKSIIAVDISTLSDHIFYGKSVVSWAFQGGEVPYLFVVLNDGTAATYSQNKSTGLMAWTRHNTDGLYKSVISYKSFEDSSSNLMFVVERNGNYCIERSSIRVLKTPTDFRAFSHGAVLYYMTYEINNPPVFTFESAGTWTVVAGADTLWTNTVRITSFVGQYFVDRVGQTFAVYVAETDSYYYMELASAVVSGTAVFNVSSAYPTSLRNVAQKLIECHTVIDGLDHLEGKEVSVVSDNVLIGSPYNEKLALPTYTVTSGEITLPAPRAYSVVGLPYVSDVETLEIDTKNGTTSLDNKIVNRVEVSFARTRGVYVGGKLPTDNSLENMEYNEEWQIVDIVNRPLAEKTGTKRYSPYSEWQLRGKMGLRQVDALPMEITSIKLDVSKG